MDRYDLVFDIVKQCKPRIIVEIGVFDGRNSKRIIQIAQMIREDVVYYGFDVFELMTKELYVKEFSKQPLRYSDVREKLQATGATIHLYKGLTVDTLPILKEQGIFPDFVFIDGGHSEETVQFDWDCVQKVMHEHAHVVFDDYFPIGQRIRGFCKGPSKVIDEIDCKKYNVCTHSLRRPSIETGGGESVVDVTRILQ